LCLRGFNYLESIAREDTVADTSNSKMDRNLALEAVRVSEAAALTQTPGAPMERHQGAYYIRLMVLDQPGVIADVAAALRDEQVSMASMIQRGRAPGEAVPVVLTTHDTVEAAMRRALDRIAALDTVLEPPRLIRIEDF